MFYGSHGIHLRLEWKTRNSCIFNNLRGFARWGVAGRCAGNDHRCIVRGVIELLELLELLERSRRFAGVAHRSAGAATTYGDVARNARAAGCAGVVKRKTVLGGLWRTMCAGVGLGWLGVRTLKAGRQAWEGGVGNAPDPARSPRLPSDTPLHSTMLHTTPRYGIMRLLVYLKSHSD